MPLSPGSQQRALQSLGWPAEGVAKLGAEEAQAVLGTGVRWDPLLGGPTVPVEEAHAYHAEAVRELHRAANTNRPGGGKAKRRFGGGRQASAKGPAQGQAARKARRGARRNRGFGQAPSGQRKAS